MWGEGGLVHVGSSRFDHRLAGSKALKLLQLLCNYLAFLRELLSSELKRMGCHHVLRCQLLQLDLQLCLHFFEGYCLLSRCFCFEPRCLCG